jgi:TATA-box binding protein (TBP) (component of TFIID and TFIIIB)
MNEAIARLKGNVMPNDFNHSTLFVVNHVITVHFGPEVSKILSSLAMQNISFRFTLECFPGLIAKLSAPKTTIMVFVSGRAVLVGSKSEIEALYVAHWTRNEFELFRQQYASHLSSKEIIFAKPRTANIVNSSCLPLENCPVDLGLYSARNWENTKYIPKKFSGCSIKRKTESYKAVIVIFEDGNFNIMGCVKQETAIICAKFIVEDMKAYQVPRRKSRAGIVEQRCSELEAAKSKVAQERRDTAENYVNLNLDGFLDKNEMDLLDKVLAADGLVINFD